jgi:hypothetical protein
MHRHDAAVSRPRGRTRVCRRGLRLWRAPVRLLSVVAAQSECSLVTPAYKWTAAMYTTVGCSGRAAVAQSNMAAATRPRRRTSCASFAGA